MRNSVRTAPFAITTCLAFLSVSLAGCGDSDGLAREAISGTVTLDGQPLADGAIQMLPINRTEGTAGGAIVKDGKYTIEREKGLLPGQYRVVISSSQAGAAAPSDGPPGPVPTSDAPKDPIPAKYNIETTLTADVKSGTPNVFPFELSTK
jgi:hypothetical protein